MDKRENPGFLLCARMHFRFYTSDDLQNVFSPPPLYENQAVPPRTGESTSAVIIAAPDWISHSFDRGTFDISHLPPLYSGHGGETLDGETKIGRALNGGARSTYRSRGHYSIGKNMQLLPTLLFEKVFKGGEGKRRLFHQSPKDFVWRRLNYFVLQQTCFIGSLAAKREPLSGFLKTPLRFRQEKIIFPPTHCFLLEVESRKSKGFFLLGPMPDNRGKKLFDLPFVGG